ncbi:hypothetical protein D3C79_753420 [compost metagenome]
MPAVTLATESTLVTCSDLLALPELANTFFSAAPLMPLPLVPRPVRLFQVSLVRPMEFGVLLPMFRSGLSATGAMSTFSVASLPAAPPSVGLYLIWA